MSPADDIDTLQLGPDPDKLERYHRQQLSAMLDGELPQDQARFLRRRLQHDGELSACFERWQVCGDVLRGRQVSLLPPDFAARVAAGIAADGGAAVPVADARRPRLWRWGGGGAALAASVALVAMFAGRPDGLVGDAAAPRPAAATASVDAAPSMPVVDVASDATALAAPASDAGIALVGAAALASADATRRAAGGDRAARARDARGEHRDAVARQAADTTRLVVADAGPAPAASQAGGVVDALPPLEAPARAWPRASSLSANSSFSVRYGDGFVAPSWDAPDVSSSAVLPRFPVDPADAAPASSGPRSLN